MPQPRVLSATRLHFPAGTLAIPEVTQKHLRAYAVATQELGIEAAIAVNSLEAEVEHTIREAAPELSVEVLHVPVWGAFVPALNTLLGEAQRRGMEYILYQSLEVTCKAAVLQFLMNFHVRDTLVVGPVLEGHTFEPCWTTPLHGRTAPWNTLAVWSVRKLALTGFLCIAEGLPSSAQRFARQCTGELASEPFQQPAMGSADWWMSGSGSMARQQTEVAEVPAGVEEVTAIALLQHVLGVDRALAVLVDLPEALLTQVSWKASWGMDERRRKWHETKMASKVARPAAQVKQLFKFRGLRRNRSKENVTSPLASPIMKNLFRRRRKSASEGSDSDVELNGSPKKDSDQPSLYFGVVHHFGEAIQPPKQVELICLASFMLFAANFAAVFSAAFRRINSNPMDGSVNNILFVSWLIGAVYAPMPLSLWVIRQMTKLGDHRAGMATCAAFLLLAHSAIVLCQLTGEGRLGGWRDPALLVARLVEGLSSGVLFQARYVLASTSTQHHHLDLQVKSFLASDVGLGIGALLPAMSSAVTRSCPAYALDLLPSAVLAMVSLAYLVWILICFPHRIHRLPDRVRFFGNNDWTELPKGVAARRSLFGTNPESCRLRLLLSGTMRVFVQSGAVLAVALCMRDVGYTGGFRQTKVVAAICLLQVPFEALASSVCGARTQPWRRQRRRRLAFGSLAMTMAGLLCTRAFMPSEMKSEVVRCALTVGELTVLLIALAISTPDSVSRLNRLSDAEHSMVTLEWMKAYIGRLFGFAFALVVTTFLGYLPLLAALFAATVLVVFTA